MFDLEKLAVYKKAKILTTKHTLVQARRWILPQFIFNLFGFIMHISLFKNQIHFWLDKVSYDIVQHFFIKSQIKRGSWFPPIFNKNPCYQYPLPFPISSVQC
jgi:hypothetical protein